MTVSTERRGRAGLLHVAAGLGPHDGGPAYSVPRLCEALGRSGADVHLLSVAYRQSQVGEVRHAGYRHTQYRWDYAALPLLRSLRASAGLARALRDEAPRSTIIHDHGMWLLPNVHAGREARRAGARLVVAPRGMLSKAALGFSPLKKHLFWTLLQRDAFREAACFHATSDQEYAEIRAFGLRAPVAVVPNGIDIGEPARDRGPDTQLGRTVLSLGRVHPKKGLDQLLRAWKTVEAEAPAWQLRIVGPSEAGHDSELKALAAALGLARASVEPAVYGQAKENLLRQADLFVLPSLNENFAVTVAEALAHGVPVISSKGAPWSGLVREGCGWWIDHGVEPLGSALRAAMARPAVELQSMGERGRAWMRREFSWERVAADMGALYGWLSEGRQRPDFVRCT